MPSIPPLAATPIAILSALGQHQRGLIGRMQSPRRVRHASRDFWLGELHGVAVVLALCGIGKVAAATTAAALIGHFGVGQIVFTGVAGGLPAAVNVGDVVVATHFMQHDMDASPLFARYEVPLYGRTYFESDAQLTALLFRAACDALKCEPQAQLARVHLGLIASGDRFISGADESQQLKESLASAGHAVLAVEMEGAAVAQVCFDHGVPFAALRTISDRADDSAHLDFPNFLEEVAGRYALAIISRFLELLPKE